MTIVPAYPDWQRVQNWDSAPFAAQTLHIFGAQETLGPFDVSRYGYLIGIDQMTNGDAQVDVQWTMDQAGTISAGSRRFMLTTLIAQAMQYRLLNLGSWVKIIYTPIGAGGWRRNTVLFASNRAHPLEVLPFSPNLIQISSRALAAGATDTLYPADYYAGPLDVWGEFPAATWFWYLQYLDTADTWQTIHVSPQTAGFVDQQVKILAPVGAWRIRVSNSSAGAGNYSIGVKHSQSGST